MADEIKNLNQAIVDAQSAFDVLQEQFADSLSVKDATISDRDASIVSLQGEAVVKDSTISTLQSEATVKDASIATLKSEAAIKDARIAELEAQAGAGIPAGDVVAATTQVQALITDIANTPT